MIENNFLIIIHKYIMILNQIFGSTLFGSTLLILILYALTPKAKNLIGFFFHSSKLFSKNSFSE